MPQSLSLSRRLAITQAVTGLVVCEFVHAHRHHPGDRSKEKEKGKEKRVKEEEWSGCFNAHHADLVLILLIHFQLELVEKAADGHDEECLGSNSNSLADGTSRVSVAQAAIS